jgi:hypothetical protein
VIPDADFGAPTATDTIPRHCLIFPAINGNFSRLPLEFAIANQGQANKIGARQGCTD